MVLPTAFLQVADLPETLNFRYVAELLNKEIRRPQIHATKNEFKSVSDRIPNYFQRKFVS